MSKPKCKHCPTASQATSFAIANTRITHTSSPPVAPFAAATADVTAKLIKSTPFRRFHRRLRNQHTISTLYPRRLYRR